MEVSIGNNSGIGINARLRWSVAIGDNVMMGPDVVILTKNHEIAYPDIPMIEQGYRKDQPVTIESDVWIGTRVIILPGVHIGSGSVIAAGAVVSKDVPNWTVVAGNPAKVVRLRR